VVGDATTAIRATSNAGRESRRSTAAGHGRRTRSRAQGLPRHGPAPRRDLGRLTLVPLPGIDVAGDVALLMELIPAINRKFGLTPEQIDRLDTTRRVMVYAMLKKVGAGLVGRHQASAWCWRR
jgi:hypothetical protein